MTAPDTLERAAYSVEQFLRRNGIGRNLFYKLVADGKIETMKVGTRRLISVEAERVWHAQAVAQLQNGASGKLRQTRKDTKTQETRNLRA